MNVFQCVDCGAEMMQIEAPEWCPDCHKDDGIIQICPMCGSAIDPDTKVCPECKEPVA